MHFDKIDKFILFGGGPILCDCIQFLLEKKQSFSVVTGKRNLDDLICSDSNKIKFKEYLERNKIDFHVSKNVNNDTAVIEKINSKTLGISSAAPWIFKNEFINSFKGNLVNLHGTRLPQDRGGGGFSWRILRNDRIGISLIHQIDEGIDTGKIIMFDQYIFPEYCRIPKDYDEYARHRYSELMPIFINKILENQSFEENDQQENYSTYWPRLATDMHAYINWNWSLDSIERFICAFDDPYKGAITFIKNNKVRFKKCIITTSDGIFHPFQKGIIYRIQNSNVYIATENGGLIISDIKDDEGNSYIDKIRIGDRFYTPASDLEKAMQYRAIYTAEGIKADKV